MHIGKKLFACHHRTRLYQSIYIDRSNYLITRFPESEVSAQVSKVLPL